jgi:hypothetical protein
MRTLFILLSALLLITGLYFWLVVGYKNHAALAYTFAAFWLFCSELIKEKKIVK